MSTAREQFMLFIRRIERIEAERADLAADVRKVFAEARAIGFTPKAMQAVLRQRRKQKPDEKSDDKSCEAYLAALAEIEGAAA